ncbi:MAG: sortase [Clostridia bacterium]|nr:sortase [Clostridia bacterium]
MKKRIIVNCFFIGAVLVIILWLIVQSIRDSKLERNNMQRFSKYDSQSLDTTYNQDNKEKQENLNNEVIEKEYPKEEIITKYKQYDVAAKLEIPEINLETYILETCTEDSLNKSVAKFWGANPNEIGNLCVAGHNAPRNTNMFYNLKKLKIGNSLTISDNTIGKIGYEIYNIYNVFPEDVSCLSQETNGEREVTLITCTNDSKQRTIIKAKEQKTST